MTVADEVGRFVAGGEHSKPELDRLALEAFGYQFERIPAYRAMCERAGRTPGRAASWREVPTVPAAAFATVELATDPPVETFRSSGTTGGERARSVHRHPFPELYRAVIDATFPTACLPTGGKPPMLALVPSRDVAPDSSLGFMVAHVLQRFGGPESIHGFGARGVEIGTCRSWLGARQRGGKPVLLLATAFALADLVAFLERSNLHFRLPAGSAIFETGGFKGRTREISRDELQTRIATRLGLPADRIVSEYGMTELTSQAYSRTLVESGADPALFVTPAWMRVRALDPATLTELPHGTPGLLAIFDLANVGSALHLLTEDLGTTEPVPGGAASAGAGGAFRLLGRAPEADLRGCSLLAEELARNA